MERIVNGKAKTAGGRLREERERLGLSQAELAEKTGISRVTLGRYETDKREIGTGFFDAAGKLGIRGEYVLTGRLIEGDALRLCAVWNVLIELARGLQLQDNVLLQLAVEKAEEQAEMDARFVAYQNLTARVVAEMLGESPVLMMNQNLLAQILETVEATLEKLGLRPPHDQKARLILMLYRAFKASGKVDRRVVDEAVGLLASTSSPKFPKFP